jgi:hypothetical protein
MPDNEALMRRVERLERANTRYASMLAMVVIGAAALSLVVANARDRTSEAERFILRDAAGKLRAELRSTPTGPALSFFDPVGAERARLQANDDGNTVLSLKTGTDDERFQRAIELRTGNDGWSSLVFSDAGARERLSVGLAYDGEPRLRMYGRQGRTRVGLGSDMCGRADLVIHDAGGQERAVLRTAPGGTPTLTLYDDEGRESFAAP